MTSVTQFTAYLIKMSFRMSLKIIRFALPSSDRFFRSGIGYRPIEVLVRKPPIHNFPKVTSFVSYRPPSESAKGFPKSRVSLNLLNPHPYLRFSKKVLTIFYGVIFEHFWNNFTTAA